MTRNRELTLGTVLEINFVLVLIILNNKELHNALCSLILQLSQLQLPKVKSKLGKQ